MKKKVLICTGGGIGGAERVSILISKILILHGYECKVLICIGENDSATLLNFVTEGMHFNIIKCRFRKLFFKLYKEIKNEKPDIVFSSMPLIIFLLAVLKTFFFYHRFKLIARQYTTVDTMKKSLFILSKLSFSFVDMIIAQTDEMRQDLVRSLGINSSKTITINNPIDKQLIQERLKDSYEMDSTYTNFVAVGRIAEAKNYEVMLQAFKYYLDSHRRARLYIVGKIGENDYAESVLKLSQKLGLNDSVFWEGVQLNPYKYVAAADAFLLSSKIEGLPNALLEAMYIGIPVVATSCVPFVSQVVKNGLNGYVVSVGDSLSMAKAMGQVTKIGCIARGVDYTHGEKKLLELFKSL